MASNLASSDFWVQARARILLDPTVTNLNTGSFGPLPQMVFSRVTELRHRLAEEPMDFLVRQQPPLLWEARRRLAEFLGGSPSQLIFTANVTASINIVAAGLTLARPGEILLTDHEYGAMHWCWERAAQRQGLKLRIVSLPVMADSPDEIVQAVSRALTDKTRLLFFSHVVSPTGLVLPAREICELARRRGIITVIDGAHAPAMIPLDLSEIRCDFYGGNCHKWLLAPTGSGFLYLGQKNEERLPPLQVSWGWHHDRDRLDEPDEFGSTARLRALEFEGTRDLCPWLTVPTAIDFQAGLGWDNIRRRIRELTNYVRSRFASLTRVQLATPTHPDLHGSMTAFRLPSGIDPAVLREHLWGKYRIEAPVIERPAGLLIRASTHFYNSECDIDLLAHALQEFLE